MLTRTSESGSMKKQMTVIANWKMYLGFNATITRITENFDGLVALTKNKDCAVYLAPTLPAIAELARIFKETNVLWCAQDCSEHIAGAYTGQVSAETLKDMGCRACIIGHSERRKYNAETSDLVANKLQVLLDYDVSPVVCIGEHEEDYRKKQTIDVLEQQLVPVMRVLEKSQQKINGLRVYIAYEPVWAIGTGVAADSEHLINVYTWLCHHIQKHAPMINVHLLYGGSVNLLNVDALKKVEQVQGFLIGKSSLDFQEFEKIVKCIMVE